MDTEDFAYLAAVTLHTIAELTSPDYVEGMLVSRGYKKKEARAMLDEAYRRRLE